MQLWRARMQLYSQQKQRKGATTVYLLCTHLSVLLKDLAPHLSHTETSKKPIKDKGVDWTSRGLYKLGALKTAGAPRDRAGYLPLVVTRWGDPRCPVPTAASVTAARPRPRRAAW